MKILAIDQGTTSTRGLILDTSSLQSLAHVCYSAEHKQYYPQNGWVEHDGNEIMAHIIDCIKSAINESDIDAIGIDNQGESCLAWDALDKRIISPIIVWQDNRTEAVIEKLKKQGLESVVKKITGLPLDGYFSATKLSWIFNNIQEAKTLHKENRLRLGTTDAYFLDKLTGHFVTDISTASRTSLMNIKSGQWDASLCELFDVPLSALPKIVATTGDFGQVVINDKSIAVRASVVDQQASLYGHGATTVGDVKITFGTGAFVLASTGNQLIQAPDNGLLPTVAWQLDAIKGSDEKSNTMYALDGGVYCAASALNWAKSLGLFSSFDEINYFDRASAISRKIAFVPALVGLACPHWSRDTKGIWLGLGIDTDAKDMLQAILEGVAFRANEVLQLMGDYVELNDHISIDGGLSVNPYFCQFFADISNKTIYVQQSGEITALGTAALVAKSAAKTIQLKDDRVVYKPEKSFAQTQRVDAINQYSNAIKLAKQW